MADPVPPSTPAAPDRRRVDLRSDAVTRPTPSMWEAMRNDPMEWSRFGDPTVDKLERRVATLVGKPAGVFVPTGTMANSLALVSLTKPGDEFIVDQHAHVVRAEDRAYDRLARLTPITVVGSRGHPTASQIARVIQAGSHPSLVWLENTHTFAGGTVAPVGEKEEIADLARASGLRVHLDGARLWNAMVATGLTAEQLVARVDSVTVNLNKGLGCPAGAVLCGASELVETARARMLGLGGSLAQAGLLATCGLAGLDGDSTWPARDHQLASHLAAELRRDPGPDVDEPDTNIILIRVHDADDLRRRLQERGVLVLLRDDETIRLVVHRDISRSEATYAATSIRTLLADYQHC